MGRPCRQRAQRQRGPAAPKNGVEFRQGSIGVIRSGLATLYEV